MKNQFNSTFDNYVLVGESITTTVDGLEVSATIGIDFDTSIDDGDCHNIDQAVTGCDDKQQAKLLQAREDYYNDKWFYCGVVLSVRKNGILIDDNAASLWGIECNYTDSDNSRLTAVANELLPEALEVGKKSLAEMINKLK